MKIHEQNARRPRAVQTKEQILTLLRDYQPQLRRLGVRRCGLFGSFVRNTSQDQSDVDILVEFDPAQKTFDHFMQLAFSSRICLAGRSI